jgi:hypothetical protein
MQNDSPGLSFALEFGRNCYEVPYRAFAANNINRAAMHMGAFAEPVWARCQARATYD